MPICVIELSYNPRKNKYKNKVLARPGFRINKSGISSSNSTYSLNVTKKAEQHLGLERNVLESAPQVYTVEEINKTVNDIKASIKRTKDECNTAISSSLKVIQAEIKTLKDLVLSDPVFKELIKQELKDELKKELLQEMETQPLSI